MMVNIKRMNMDFGNSMTFAMINGEANVIEIPTAVVEVSETKARGYFTDDIPKSKLKNSLLLKVENKYLLVGEAAEMVLGNDQHIGVELHEKSNSKLSKIMFFAALALYDAEQNNKREEKTTITIDYISTMLPIFELLDAEKFSDKTNAMAERFNGNFSFEVMTNGCRKQIVIESKEESKCYVEGLVAKFALKYKFDLTENETAEKFDRNITINNDLGGGTIDQVRLPKRLENPKSRNDFKTITEAPFLGAIKELYEHKLRKYHFKSSRDVEKFIVKNYESEKYIVVDANTGIKTDVTEIVENALREYTNTIMPIIFNQFSAEQGEVYKYNYFGGVAPIIRKFIEQYVTNKYGQDVFQQYHHIEPDRTARFLNLYGLEIISRQNTLVNK